MLVADLRELADDLGLEHDGMVKAEVRQLILDHLAEEVPF